MPLQYLPGRLAPAAQAGLMADLRTILVAAPLFTPTMPRSGKSLSVRMTNCGPLGWMTDARSGGYRYQVTHPETGKAWPPIPQGLLELWRGVTSYPAPPEACLVNYYAADANMGLHHDKDELDFAAPVLSVSLGEPAFFRVGGITQEIPPEDSSSNPATWWCWAERTGSPITVSTASCPAPRPASRGWPLEPHAAAGGEAELSLAAGVLAGRSAARRSVTRGNRHWPACPAPRHPVLRHRPSLAFGDRHESGPEAPVADDITRLHHVDHGALGHVGVLHLVHGLMAVRVEARPERLDAHDAVALEHVEQLPLGELHPSRKLFNAGSWLAASVGTCSMVRRRLSPTTTTSRAKLVTA